MARPRGVTLLVAFFAVGAAMWREWGRRTAIAVLVINMGGDTVSALARHDWRALFGLPIGGAMVLYLCGRPMREWIAQSTR